MASVEAAWAIGNLLMARSTILWIVDLDGSIRFAIEEYVDGDDPTNITEEWYQDIPYHKNTGAERYRSLLPKSSKLGHPSLVGGNAARIAGEIYFFSSPTKENLEWRINASSGRYGVWHKSAQRKVEHLRNVQYKFLSHRIGLRIDLLGFEK